MNVPVYSSVPTQQVVQGYVYPGPVFMAVPAFATVVAVPVPPEWGKVVSPELLGILSIANSFTIRQHVKWLPKSCCKCPPCVRQENTYSIYAGLNQNAEHEFLRVDEVSDDWNRCCCAPMHPLKLEVRSYIPLPGDGSRSDYSHVREDILRDWNSFNTGRRQELVGELYKAQPPLFTIVRNDGMRCCYKCPCKCLNSFVCCECCEDGVKVYAGAVENPPDGKELGRPVETKATLIGEAKQPICAGGCHPQIDLFGREGAFGKVEGPYCFGGCIEYCFSFRFYASRTAEKAWAGDLGLITKKKPTSVAGVAREFFAGEADVFTIDFPAQKPPTHDQKLVILASQLLVDYMYFDGSTAEKCYCDANGITCYWWYCSIFGCVAPCCTHIPFPKDG